MRNKPRGRRKEFYEGEKGKKKKGRRKEDGDEKKKAKGWCRSRKEVEKSRSERN